MSVTKIEHHNGKDHDLIDPQHSLFNDDHQELHLEQLTNTVEFNSMRTLDAFKACITNDGMDVDLPKFIFAFREFTKMVNMLGRLSVVISWELNDKCDNIDKCILSEPDKYTTVSSAIEYEKIQGIHRVNKNVSISQLRLKRGLDLIRRIVENCFTNLESERKLPELAYEAYEQTLAFRHKWAVRHLVRMGMHFLPNKHDLIDMILKTAPPCENEKERNVLIYDFIDTIDKVHGIVHKIYDDNDFLELVFV